MASKTQLTILTFDLHSHHCHVVNFLRVQLIATLCVSDTKATEDTFTPSRVGND